jgi:PAS domain S-box-containing protein
MIRLSIKSKFIIGSIGIIVLLGVTVMAFVKVSVVRHLEHELMEKGVVLSENFADMAVEPVLTDNYVSLQMMVNDFLNYDVDIRYVIVSDHKGRIIAHTFGETFPADLIEANVLEPGTQTSIENLVTEQGPIIDMAVPILKGDAGVVRVGFSERHINETVSRVSRSLLVTVLAVMGAGCLISVVLGNAITRPIVELKRMAEAVGEGNLELKAEVNSDDEAGHLAASFNLMTDKLKSTRDELEYALMELENYSRNLEDKVKQRTADLMATKEELEQEVLERKRAEDELKLTQFTVDNAADSIFWIKSDARFAYVNEAACNSLGYSREELLSMTVHDIDPGFPKDAWPDHWREIKERGSFSLETNHRTKNGMVFPVEVSVNYLKYGEKEYNCAFVRDITERKLTEKETVRAAQLASS